MASFPMWRCSACGSERRGWVRPNIQALSSSFTSVSWFPLWEAEVLMFIFPSPDYSGFNIPGSSGVFSMLGYFCKVSYLKVSVLAVPSLWNVLSLFFLLENFFFHTVFSRHSFLLYQVLPDPLSLSSLSTLNLSFSLFKKQTKEETHTKNFSQNRNQI